MAHIVMAEASGQLDALYGKFQYPIARMLEQRVEAFERESIAKLVFAKRVSNHFVEGYAGLTAMDDFEPVPENGAYPMNGYESGYAQMLENITWKSSCAISRELVEDSNFERVKRKPEALVNAYHRTQERFFARLLGTALKGETSFQQSGMTFSTKSADGVCQFATNHKPKVKGANQSNSFSDAFSEEALSKAATAMQNFKGDNGETLGLTPDTIIIPNIADLKAEVFGVLGAYNSTNEAGSNKYNYLFGQWTVQVWPYLNDFIEEGSKPWVLLDSRYNQAADGAVWQQRRELEIISEIASTDANVWKGSARFTGGFVDFRALAAGGMTGGSSL